ncbi:hypothetical protein ABIE18_000154 [Arthrobacter sp. 2762]
MTVMTFSRLTLNKSCIRPLRAISIRPHIEICKGRIWNRPPLHELTSEGSDSSQASSSAARMTGLLPMYFTAMVATLYGLLDSGRMLQEKVNASLVA